MVRAIVLYHSLFGNTRNVAMSLADGLRTAGVETDCLGIDGIEISDLELYDLIALGSPTHNLRPAKPMKDFLKEMRSVNLKGKFAYSFDSRNESGMNKSSYLFLENSAARVIEGKIKSMGMKVLRPRDSALVNGREGPLYPDEEERFHSIGNAIGELLCIQLGSVESSISD